FFFQAEDGIRDRNVTGVQTCALPIYCRIRAAAEAESRRRRARAATPSSSRISGATDRARGPEVAAARAAARRSSTRTRPPRSSEDRKSTRLNSSHVSISYAVFCLKKK